MSNFYHSLFLSLFSLTVLLTGYVNADPFRRCPSEAFLIQDGMARIYGVNLATGYYEELSNDMGTTGKINASGFSFHDNYIYGYGYEENTLVRIGDNFQAVALSVSGLPNTSFYVGDVALHENAYYMYRSGRDYGLYKVGLDEASSDYLTALRIVDGSTLNLRIFDLAFHPNNQYIYSVTNTGDLVRIDPNDGSVETIANVGESGTFGAVYFDVDGNFYISRNADGGVFRIDVGATEPRAEFFAFGPSSSNNDGARCALSPIVAEDDPIDFGDAPDTYGTSVSANGARHQIVNDVHLGDAVKLDDGVVFVTGFETGLDTLVTVEANAHGYLSAWVDWNQNGLFDEDEAVIVDKPLSVGSNRALLDVPADAVEGSTWSRFRVSSIAGLGPTGGVSDGEVEDYEIDVTPSGVSIVSYPSSAGYVTLAYEDNWPTQGDYDMNDVVMAYQTETYIDEMGRVIRYDVAGHILALGASYHNGFAIQLDGINTGNIHKDLMRFELNGVQQLSSALEDNAPEDDAVLVIADDLWEQVLLTPECEFYRTQVGCDMPQEFSFFVSAPLVSSVASTDAPTEVLNPFIFATPGIYHGEGFPVPPGRSLEIHLKNKPVTARFDLAYFGMRDDNSDFINDYTFVTENNMPWALEIPVLWSHPVERTDLIDAYPEFSEFVTSEGAVHTTWYVSERAVSDRVIVND